MFELILPYVILITLVGTGSVLWAKWMIQRAANQIERRHRAAELIVNDGEVPPAWIEQYRQRVEALGREGGTPADISAVTSLAQVAVGRELDRLVKYLTTTRLVADEHTRETLITGIAGRRQEWDQAGWENVIDPTGTATGRSVNGCTTT